MTDCRGKVEKRVRDKKTEAWNISCDKYKFNSSECHRNFSTYIVQISFERQTNTCHAFQQLHFVVIPNLLQFSFDADDDVHF